MTRFELDELLASLDGIGTWPCKRWRDEIFRRNPIMAPILVPAYRRTAAESGHIAANTWLRETESRLRIGKLPLTVGADDDALKDQAKVLAKALRDRVLLPLSRRGPAHAMELAAPLFARSGIDPGVSPDSEEKKVRALLARACEEKWWLRKLKMVQRQGYEGIVRELGYVSKRCGIYVSDFNFERRIQQKRSNRALLESFEAENEQGDRFTLAELADLSPSNPMIKLAELMVRMRGFEEIAMASPDEYVGLFITVTCPSKFHAVHSNGRLNHKFNGATPRDAQSYLNGLWCRVRASWARESIHPFGMRVVEPHHDGTPHWHLLLFVPRDQKGEMLRTFRAHSMREDGEEAGAQAHRFKVEEIDPERGSATGYIAKYIAKNVNGQGLETDLYGRDAVTSAMRIEAWAAVWCIRQFQQIGGPSVTVYREARRMSPEEQYPEPLASIRRAADGSDWGAYTLAMGGAICSRKERPAKPLMGLRASLGRYGEPVRAIKGLVCGALEIITRIHTWTVSPRAISHIWESPENARAPSRGEPGSGGLAQESEPGDCPGSGVGSVASRPGPIYGESQARPGLQTAADARIWECGSNCPYEENSTDYPYKGKAQPVPYKGAAVADGFFRQGPLGPGILEYCH